MVILKSLIYLVIGAVVGTIIGFIVGVGIYIVVGIAVWNSKTGNDVGMIAWFLCGVIGSIVGFITPINEESERQEKERERQAVLVAKEQKRQADLMEEERKRQTHQEEELRKRIEYLERLLFKSKQEIICLHKHVSDAEMHLDRAEYEFMDGAFAPFWDEIERAITRLATYQRGIEMISRNTLEYNREAQGLSSPVMPFIFPKGALLDARPATSRLETMVRKAQKNFQFASIYEQRKTNRILVAGFETLASAVYQIGDSISSSLDGLSSSMQTSLGDLLVATTEHSRQMQMASEREVQMLNEQGKMADAEASSRRKFEDDVVQKQSEQIRILENIQRRGKI